MGIITHSDVPASLELLHTGTQTTGDYTVIDNPDECVFNNVRIVKGTFVFFKQTKSDHTTEKATMTSYNSKVWKYMDFYIQQLIDSGDF